MKQFFTYSLFLSSSPEVIRYVGGAYGNVNRPADHLKNALKCGPERHAAGKCREANKVRCDWLREHAAEVQWKIRCRTDCAETTRDIERETWDDDLAAGHPVDQLQQQPHSYPKPSSDPILRRIKALATWDGRRRNGTATNPHARIRTKEQRDKGWATRRARGNDGTAPWSAERRANHTSWNRGKHLTPEHRVAIGKSHKPLPQEAIARMAETKRGKKDSAKTRSIKSEAQRARRARERAARQA